MFNPNTTKMEVKLAQILVGLETLTAQSNSFSTRLDEVIARREQTSLDIQALSQSVSNLSVVSNDRYVREEKQAQRIEELAETVTKLSNTVENLHQRSVSVSKFYNMVLTAIIAVVVPLAISKFIHPNENPTTATTDIIATHPHIRPVQK